MVKNYIRTGIVFLGIFLVSACNTDNESAIIESDVIVQGNYTPKTIEIPLEVNNIKLKAVQTNGLSVFQLGKITQGELGSTTAGIVSQVQLPVTSPIFGELSQVKEDENNNPKVYNENETIEKVYLYLPFSVKGVANSQNYDISKAIFGSTTGRFKLQVHQLDYNLREVNPNFEPQRYFSDQQVPLGEVLVTDAPVQISNEAIVRYQFDDPTTTEDESQKEKDKLKPGIRVELSNKDFFQKILLSNEGKDVLSSNTEFVKEFKGLVITATDFSEEVLALMDLNNARIEMIYNYIYKNSEGNVFNKKGITELSLSGIAFATYDYQNQTAVIPQSDDIYIKGGRYMATLTIHQDQIKKLQSQKMVVTDASISFYVNEDKILPTDFSQLPSYLLIFDAQTGNVLVDYSNDIAVNNKITTAIEPLQKDADGKMYYKVRLTDHLINVLRGRTDNVKLGLIASLDNMGASMGVVQYKNQDDTTANALLGNSQNSLYTIIHGNGANAPEPYKLKLKVKYSLINH